MKRLVVFAVVIWVVFKGLTFVIDGVMAEGRALQGDYLASRVATR